MGGLFGGSPTIAPVSTPPPPAPPSEEAALEEFTDEEVDKKKQVARTQGAKSLQIPLGSTEAVGTVGKV